jgi:hypothetical protein
MLTSMLLTEVAANEQALRAMQDALEAQLIGATWEEGRGQGALSAICVCGRSKRAGSSPANVDQSRSR